MQEQKFQFTDLQKELLFNDEDFKKAVNKIVFTTTVTIEKPYLDIVLDRVCSYFSITREDLSSRSHKLKFTLPRQLCMYILYETRHLTGIKPANIPAIFDRDRTILSHAIKVIEGEATYNKDINKLTREIISLIELKNKHNG